MKWVENTLEDFLTHDDVKKNNQLMEDKIDAFKGEIEKQNVKLDVLKDKMSEAVYEAVKKA